MKKDYKVYIKLFAIFLFVLLILQTIRLDGFQDLNNMVDSQGIVITSPASVPMTTSQTVADPEVAAVAEEAIASASAAYAELEDAPQLLTRTTYVEPSFDASTRTAPAPVFLAPPVEAPVIAPVTPPPVTPPPVVPPPVVPPPVVSAPVVPPPVAPPTVTPPTVTPPVTPPPVTAPVTPPATNTITQATANASALAATAAVASTSTSNSQVTPLATDTTTTSTTTYILIGIIAVGGIATATVLINTK